MLITMYIFLTIGWRETTHTGPTHNAHPVRRRGCLNLQNSCPLRGVAGTTGKPSRMAFGARGSARDFGLSSGLVLPALEREHYATSGQAFMPDEKKGRKKEFAVKQDVSRLDCFLLLLLFCF